MLQNGPKSKRQTFTSRERKMLRLIAEGYRKSEIARDLNISVKALEKVRTELLRKLKLRTVSSALEFALRVGIISLYEILESRFSKSQLRPS